MPTFDGTRQRDRADFPQSYYSNTNLRPAFDTSYSQEDTPSVKYHGTVPSHNQFIDTHQAEAGSNSESGSKPNANMGPRKAQGSTAPVKKGAKAAPAPKQSTRKTKASMYIYPLT